MRPGWHLHAWRYCSSGRFDRAVCRRLVVKCLRCQHENPPGSAFCLECGRRLAPACASCGAELPAGSKFCNKCGTPVATEAPTQLRFASPEAYTPKHLAERIINSKAAL